MDERELNLLFTFKFENVIAELVRQSTGPPGKSGKIAIVAPLTIPYRFTKTFAEISGEG